MVAERDTVIDWADVKGAFLSAVERGEKPSANFSGTHRERLMRLHRDPERVDNWEGGSGAFTMDALKHGYKAPEFKHAAQRVPRRQRRRSSWNAQMGRPNSSRLICGDPNFYRKPVRRDRKPGLRLKIQAAFSASTDAATIKDYGTWVAGLIKSLESSGFDMTVDLWIPLDNLFHDRRGRENVYIRVKRSGERADFTEWSSIFGPTGYRHLIFTAKCVAGEKLGVRTDDTLGTTLRDSKWGVEYDRAKQEVLITVHQRNGKLATENLTQQAKDAGLI